MTADVLSKVPTDLFIGGTWRAASEGGRFDVLDPATGDVIAQVADGSVDDGLAAVDAASEALPAWAATPPRQRAEILRRAWELMIERADEIATLISLENGKALVDAIAVGLVGNDENPAVGRCRRRGQRRRPG